MKHETRGYRLFRRSTLTVLTVFVCAPLVVMVTTALKPLDAVQGGFHWIPTEPTVRPFVDMWSTVPLARYFANSVIVAGIATALSVTVAVLAAYAVSRWRFRGREPFRLAILSTQMFPGILFLLPLFLLFVMIDRLTGVTLVGTRTGLVITYLTFALPYSIWMLVGYFESIPRGLDDAAKVDGCGPLRLLVSVLLPAARPVIVAVTIFSFMLAWGEVLFASVLTAENTRTLSVGLQAYTSEANVYWNQVMAASLVVSAPLVVAFLLLQRHITAGLTAGAVK
ncbi:carbohydrate ABC transporter permease [Cryptosporangium arvum]|uniref:carbohydrate ABC transporter permease n=1 Tax=Cryptosporangium arvum TaxID=80871 RepID=UPI0004B7CFA1|nr:carbohydrate ABC transporter permease [Cryptosporangium arvum]